MLCPDHPKSMFIFKILSRPPNRPAKKRLKINCSNSDEVKSLKRQNYYKDEQLSLDCEWAECDESADSSAAFAKHVAQHVKEAEVGVHIGTI